MSKAPTANIRLYLTRRGTTIPTASAKTACENKRFFLVYGTFQQGKALSPSRRIKYRHYHQK